MMIHPTRLNHETDDAAHLRYLLILIWQKDLSVLLYIGAIFLDKMTLSHLRHNLQNCGT